jgi:hypothetical protein
MVKLPCLGVNGHDRSDFRLERKSSQRAELGAWSSYWRHRSPWEVEEPNIRSEAAMPKKTVPERVERLARAFKELCAAGRWPPQDLTCDPSYPKYVYIIRPQDPEDDYFRELVRRALKAQGDMAEEDDDAAEDETLLRPSGPGDPLAKGIVVYRLGNDVWQIGEVQTPTAASVLGRVGVVDLICRKLEECLAHRGMQDEKGKPWKLTIADLARLIEGSTDPDEEIITPRAKRLERLNAGSLVFDDDIPNAAKILRLSPPDLFFDNTGVYRANGFDERHKMFIEKIRAKYLQDLNEHTPALIRLFARACSRLNRL